MKEKNLETFIDANADNNELEKNIKAIIENVSMTKVITLNMAEISNDFKKAVDTYFEKCKEDVMAYFKYLKKTINDKNSALNKFLEAEKNNFF